MNLENLKVEELSLQEKRDLNGGVIITGAAIALGALCVAAFAIGYEIGKDYAQR